MSISIELMYNYFSGCGYYLSYEKKTSDFRLVVLIKITFFPLNHNIQNILVLVAYGGNMVNMCVSNVSNKELFK